MSTDIRETAVLKNIFKMIIGDAGVTGDNVASDCSWFFEARGRDDHQMAPEETHRCN